MDFRRLTLESLPELEAGIIKLAFDACALRAGHDCEDRPFDLKPRVIVLKVEVTPKVRGDGRPDGVGVQVFVDDKMPAKRTNKLHMHIDQGSITCDADNLKDSHPTLGFGRNENEERT